MRCWVGVPWPAGLGLGRARPKEVSLIAVTSELPDSAGRKMMICWSFRAAFGPGLSLCRIVVPRAVSRKLAQAGARHGAEGSGWVRRRSRSVERLAGHARVAAQRVVRELEL